MQNPFSFIKLQITNQRIPIEAVEMRMEGSNWTALKRSDLS